MESTTCTGRLTRYLHGMSSRINTLPDVKPEQAGQHRQICRVLRLEPSSNKRPICFYVKNFGRYLMLPPKREGRWLSGARWTATVRPSVKNYVGFSISQNRTIHTITRKSKANRPEPTLVRPNDVQSCISSPDDCYTQSSLYSVMILVRRK